MRRLNSAALSTLRSFEAVARLLSFTRAAEELCITQGAVSQHIKALEERLGCKLFFRLPGQIKLTDDGKKFAEVVTRALQKLEGAAEMLAMSDKSKISVRLRTSSSFALRWLIPRLGRLHARHPQIKLHLLGDDRCFDPACRDFDLAIELTRAPPPGLHAEFLMDDYLTPVCSAEYLSKHPFLRTPAALARCTLLHDERAPRSATEDTEWRYWLRLAGAPLVDSGQGQFFTSTNMAMEAALAHQGVALGRLSLLEGPLATRTLAAPLSQRIKSPGRHLLLSRHDVADRPGVKDLATWLHDEGRDASQAYLRPSSANSVGIDVYGRVSGNTHSAVSTTSAFSHAGATVLRVTAA